MEPLAPLLSINAVPLVGRAAKMLLKPLGPSPPRPISFSPLATTLFIVVRGTGSNPVRRARGVASKVPHA